MNLKQLSTSVLFSSVLTLSVNASDFPVPAWVETVEVTSGAKVQGLSMKIKKFTSEKGEREVLSYYLHLWEKRAAITKMAPWLMIGKLENDQFFNVQIQSAGSGSWGYLSVSDLPQRLEEGANYDFPAMSGSQFLDSQRHSDALNTSRTYLLRNSFTVDGNSQYYINYYSQRGWRLQQDSKESGLKGRVLRFSKGREAIVLTVQAAKGGSEVVVNATKKKVLGG